MKASLRAGVLVSLSLLLPTHLSAQRQPRVIFVDAVDQAGVPVLNLTATDFEVREGTEKKTVTFAGLSNAPMRVVLLMETSQTAEPFILATDGPESSANMQDAEFTRMANDMLARGTTVHAALVQRTGSTILHEIAMILAKNSGGVLETLTSGSALPDKMKAIAARIVSDHQKMTMRYQLEYISDAKYNGSVDVGVLNEGVKSNVSLRRPF